MERFKKPNVVKLPPPMSYAELVRSAHDGLRFLGITDHAERCRLITEADEARYTAAFRAKCDRIRKAYFRQST